ncbi:MAG: hypothetical protein ABH821_06060 [archaeon]
MQSDTRKIIYSIVLLSSIFLWNYFLIKSGLSLSLITNLFNLQEVVALISGTNFILFALTLPLSFAVVIMATKKFHHDNIHLYTLLPAIIGVIIFWIFFANALTYLFFGLFFTLALVLVINNTENKQWELKTMVNPRTFYSSMQKGVMIITIGLFLVAAFNTYNNQEALVAEFEDNLFSAILDNENLESLQNNELLQAQYNVNLINQSIDLLTENQYFTLLKASDAKEAQNYVSYTTAVQEQVNSKEYKQQLQASLDKQAKKLDSETIKQKSLELLKQSMPTFALIEQMFWLVAALITASLFWLFGNILVVPLGTLYCLILNFFDKEKRKEEDIKSS